MIRQNAPEKTIDSGLADLQKVLVLAPPDLPIMVFLVTFLHLRFKYVRKTIWKRDFQHIIMNMYVLYVTLSQLTTIKSGL